VLELPRSFARRAALLLASAGFVFAGVSHFTNTEFFIGIMPPYLPAHRELVHASGVCEILGGLGILVAATRRLAAVGLIALLVAVYPANIHMALHPEQFPDLSPAALLLRLPLQFVFMAWVWWATRPDRPLPEPA
jgi:uncharacterized membrane protein